MFTLDDAISELELSETAGVSVKVENGEIAMQIVPWSNEVDHYTDENGFIQSR
jgi:hypothetical protein